MAGSESPPGMPAGVRGAAERLAARGITTSAERRGDDWVINGSKIFITNGQHADLIIVAAKTDPKEGAKGISLVVVETEGAVVQVQGVGLAVAVGQDQVRMPVLVHDADKAGGIVQDHFE